MCTLIDDNRECCNCNYFPNCEEDQAIKKMEEIYEENKMDSICN